MLFSWWNSEKLYRFSYSEYKIPWRKCTEYIYRSSIVFLNWKAVPYLKVYTRKKRIYIIYYNFHSHIYSYWMRYIYVSLKISFYTVSSDALRVRLSASLYPYNYFWCHILNKHSLLYVTLLYRLFYIQIYYIYTNERLYQKEYDIL